jgi:hypothetical protein
MYISIFFYYIISRVFLYIFPIIYMYIFEHPVLMNISVIHSTFYMYLMTIFICRLPDSKTTFSV